jgi:GDP-mannose transporter
MSDKKNEDYAIRMPDSDLRNGYGGEKDPFLGSSSRSSAHRQRSLAMSVSKLDNSPGLSILAYCLSSISMTVVNKYCVSGNEWNLNFFYLGVQVRPLPSFFISAWLLTFCARQLCASPRLRSANKSGSSETSHRSTLTRQKNVGLQRLHRQTCSLPTDPSFFAGFPISVLLVGMIYTSTKSLQFLSVPVYTIFKNLTIIVIAYGEVLWFGGSVTPLALLSFGLMVLSSVVAAWADIQSAIHGSFGASVEASAAIATLNAGYAWMGMNVFCTASYILGMKKVIKKMNFKDWDSKCRQQAAHVVVRA